MLKTVNFAENTTYREKWSYELRMLIIAQLQNAMKIQSFNILKPSPIRIPAIPYYIPCALRIGG